MKSSAFLKNLRIAPRKVRMITDLVRGKKVAQAQALLGFAIKKGAHPLLKLLNSAVANATHNAGAVESNLYISKIIVNEGPKLKRSMPRAKGQAYPIYKRTSHIKIVLDEVVPGESVKKVEKETPQKEKTGKEPARQKFARYREIKTQKEVRRDKRIFRRKVI